MLSMGNKIRNSMFSVSDKDDDEKTAMMGKDAYLTILAVVLGVNFLVGKFVDVLLLEAGSRDSAPRAEDA